MLAVILEGFSERLSTCKKYKLCISLFFPLYNEISLGFIANHYSQFVITLTPNKEKVSISKSIKKVTLLQKNNGKDIFSVFLSIRSHFCMKRGKQLLIIQGMRGRCSTGSGDASIIVRFCIKHKVLLRSDSGESTTIQ